MNLPFKVNERERKFLMYGAVAGILIIGFNLFTWYSDKTSQLSEFTDAKLFMIEKQLNKIAEKGYIEKYAVSTRQELDRQEKSLLKGGKPPVAAATLQRSLKEMASSLGIDVKLERTLNPVDTEIYLGIPVEIGFKATTNELKSLLVKVRKSSYLLTISEVKVRVTNINNPEDIYTTLVVTGFIKKTAEEEKGKKEARNAA